ncbi:PspC domain-containing protein [Dyadobacter sandarakinus]|uniref:PspC domain-containing protein n=1 Tax=Dyadobacter sandarakinus TaxID=2747268 RepID=A0ABX7I916_9BACT|nr:PspC domain-containing protein [Dyadobacter sandarakinus]QRR02385.1 PspC domain-containing protein [Dyadobacter sandarakinus]
MKKTISINIGGVIFHIEEDGYEKLKVYLSSVQRYFSSFADSKEIISDIESRIAERFYNKQKAENKQVISLADVDELIAAMGTVADFEAIEQAEDILADPLETAARTAHTHTQIPREEPSAAPFPPKTEAPRTSAAPRKLFRDLRRKLIGGVAAGLAHHFTIDPIWVRLAFLFAVIGLPAGSGMLDLNMEDAFGPFSAFVTLVYIAMWIAFPGSVTLEEDAKIKKFYRDPDRKVVGGVAAGVASYFGVDLGVVRFIWVLSILLFGTGVIIYIVLWVIAPAAKTLTEKMEMQGEPITLSNIESNIKQSLNLDEKAGEEHIVTKILLFPFRAIALIITAVGKLLRGVGPVLRIFIGVLLVAMAVMSLLGLLIGGSVAFGLASFATFDDLPAPFLIFQELPGVVVFSGLLVAAVPLITFLLLGLTLLSNKRVVTASVWLTLLGLWIVGIIGATIGGVSYQRNFAKRGEILQTSYYAFPQGTLTLDRREDHEEENIGTSIKLTGYNASTDSLRLEKTIYARGRTREDARKNAEGIQYNPEFRDSLMIFAEGPALGTKGPFRDQHIDLNLNIPYNKTFRITRDFYYQLSHWEDNHKALTKYNLEGDEVIWKNLLWTMRPDSGLICVNLPAQFLNTESNQENQENEDMSINYDNEDSNVDLGERGNYIKQFTVGTFNKVQVAGAFSVIVRPGSEFNVSADSDSQEDVDNLSVYTEDGELHIKRKDEFSIFDSNKWKRVGLVITMPTVEGVAITGANRARIVDFTGLNKLNVDVSGASKVEVSVETVELDVDMSGASKLYLKGSARNAHLEASGACKMTATDMRIEQADVKASGASKIELGHIPQLNSNANGASKINAQQ